MASTAVSLVTESTTLAPCGDERRTGDPEIVLGESAVETLKLIGFAASSMSSVLITGETGVGKNLVARIIHDRSALRASRFVSINCAALPEHLVEAELFGYERGAFTGAVSSKKGIFELAEGGTLLLDELGEMPLHIQTKLLGVLDDGQVRRLGSESARRVTTRIIVTTNVNLEESLGKTFRRDLYYRLSVIPISLLPLRQRLDEIPSLCRHLLAKMNGGVAVALSDHEIVKLQQYSWPGNVRELRNVLERSLVVFRGAELRPSVLIAQAQRSERVAAAPADEPDVIYRLDHMEREHICRVLMQYGGNITHAAQALGVSISTLKRKKRLYCLG